MTRRTIAVIGASGFIGSTCAQALEPAYNVVRVPAPRIVTPARTLKRLEGCVVPSEVNAFAQTHLEGVDVLVNAAGLATATSSDMSSLLGANAVLPLFLARAAHAAAVDRMIHVSSAAVQGRGTLDSSERLVPETTYALSKALAEVLLRQETSIEIVRYRPTSVHGASRPLTRGLIRLASSRAAAVAAPGTDPTPQMPVGRAAEAILALSDLDSTVQSVAHHPWEGVSTGEFMADLGGQEPRLIRRKLARRAVLAAYCAGGRGQKIRAEARRLDLLLFGQPQADSWLSQRLTRISTEWIGAIRSETLTSAEAGDDPRPNPRSRMSRNKSRA